MWHVGEKIVCVDTKWQNDTPIRSLPVLGGVYTIRGIDDVPDSDGSISFVLEEVVNEVDEYEYENHFLEWHFKPVKPASIDVFTSILNKVKVPENA